MPRVLVTGGRAPATLELVRSLHAGGCEVISAESVPFTLASLSRAVERDHRVPRPRQEPEAFVWHLLDLVRRDAIDVVLGTCEEIFHIVRGRDVLDPHVEVFAPGAEAMARLHHKGRFPEWAASLGLPVPETHVLTDPDALRDRIRSDGSGLVAKPAFSRFATHVRVGVTDPGFVDTVEVSEAVPWVVQERLDGMRLCSWSVVRDGRVQAHAVYPMSWSAKTGAALRWVSVDEPRIDAWVADFARRTGLTGQLAFDWFVDPERGPLPIECNPRLTSGVHLFGARNGALAEAFFGERDTPLRPGEARPSAVFFALVLYGGPERRELGLQRALADMRVRDVLWQANDPVPFVLNWLAYVVFVAWALRLGISPMAASTWDIEWNGE
ncbi:MAG: carbamoylphosphate synthase large subunit [Myxococcota bacterium]